MKWGRPRCNWSWTWQGKQRIRKDLLVCQPEKKGQRKGTSIDKQDWQTSKNGWEGWGSQQLFCLSLKWQPSLPQLSSGWTIEWGLVEQSHFQCKRGAVSWWLEKPGHTKVCRTRWDASQIPKGIGWCTCQAILHNIWEVTAVRWSPRCLKKGKGCTHL